MKRRKLYVPVGIPGSGKSTWVRTMLNGVTVVSSDEIRKELFGDLRSAHDVSPEQKKENNRRVWDIFYLTVKVALELEDVVADGTNLRDFAREKLRVIAEEMDAELHCIVFSNTMQAFKRNKERPFEQIVPNDVMNHFLGQFNEEYAYINKEVWDSYTEINKLD